jgi:hypothetical protein
MVSLNLPTREEELEHHAPQIVLRDRGTLLRNIRPSPDT